MDFVLILHFSRNLTILGSIGSHGCEGCGVMRHTIRESELRDYLSKNNNAKFHRIITHCESSLSLRANRDRMLREH